MAIKSTEELLTSIRGLISDDTTDEALALFGDISDTITSLTDDKNTNYKQLYEQNDKEWREKYRDRFMSGKPAEEKEPDFDDDRPNYSFENLFKKEGN